MFPEATFILSGVILLGMIIYRVDERRLNDDPDEIRNKLPELQVVRSVRRAIDSVIYFVGIRAWRLFRAIKKRFKSKQLTDKSK
jgi:hypothetical protein